MKKLRYGIVSASSIVPRFIGAVQSTDHSEILAIASQSDKAESIAQKYSIPKTYSSYQDMYLDPEIDIVYIANINEYHVTEIRNALHNNKHVLCEKPFVLYPEEVLELFDLAKEKNLFLMEAQKSPFLPVTKHLQSIIDSNQLGKLNQIKINNSYAGRVPENHWMHQPHQGGIWIPSANYILEYLQVICGAPLAVNVMTHPYTKDGTIGEAHLTLEYPNEVFAQCSLTLRNQTDDMTYFYFENGYVEIYQNWKARQLIVHTFGQDSETHNYPVEFELVYEVDHVYDRLSKGHITSDIMTPEVTYDCVSLVHEVYLLSQEKENHS